MKVNEVIEAYVTDVAVLLPRRQRNDVAFELRALLAEGLRDRAGDAGREADEAMAVAFLNDFGRPEDVAARYRPALTVIDPADGHRFLRLAIIGMVVIWIVGLLDRLQQPMASTGDTLQLIGQWWGAILSIVIGSLWWPGVLVVGFGLGAWVQRRWPQTGPAWKPRDESHLTGGRAAMVLGLLGILGGSFLLVNPHWLLDTVWGGRAAPAAYAALTYTETFMQRQGPLLLALILLNVPMFLVAIVRGRHSPALRRAETPLNLVLCAVMAWTVFDGPAMMAPASDGMFKLGLVVITLSTLLGVVLKWRKRVDPMPA
jgi:hypothetical protein